MQWNWQLPTWPQFVYDASSIAELEKRFLQGTGGLFAVLKHIDEGQQSRLIIDLLATEGVKSAEIEGEKLRRASLQSSIQQHFGLYTTNSDVAPKEAGMSELLWSVYDSFEKPLTHEMLYEWHTLVMQGDTRVEQRGGYRTHREPMQIVSGRLDRHQVYFEAPPSDTVYGEMTEFIEWFNTSKGKESPLCRASIAHIYFESIHPFEDGNGRIGRALVEKALSQSIGYPTLIPISEEIAKGKKGYYNALAMCNRTLEVGNWLTFFASVILEAQKNSLQLVDFVLAKCHLLDSLRGTINSRQEKALLRMFAEGPKGFTGGLSAHNYMKITRASRSTATRDLADLVQKGALKKTGQLRHARYYLTIKGSS
jgi:Fic family protein